MKKIILILTILIFLSIFLYLTNRKKTDVKEKPASVMELKESVDSLKTENEQVISSTGERPSTPLTLPKDFEIRVFQKNLNGVRDLQFSPGGTLLVSEPKLGRVLALPDRDKDGKADEIIVVIDGLNNPHGLAFYNQWLYVAEETKVTRYTFDEEDLTAKEGKDLISLPPGGRHKTRSIALDSKGKMYISIGSTCDVCFEDNEMHGSILTSDKDGFLPKIYAKGLRNAVFMKLRPNTNELWATEMGRDYLGDDNPPDEVNIIQENADYGWPLCYGDKKHDDKFDPKDKYSSRCPDTVAPVYQIPAHSAPLGLAFIANNKWPEEYQGDLLVAYHGSWNRTQPDGYKVVRLQLNGQRVTGAVDFIDGFIIGSEAKGRPVDLEFGQSGALYLSDDKEGFVYIVYYSGKK